MNEYVICGDCVEPTTTIPTTSESSTVYEGAKEEIKSSTAKPSSNRPSVVGNTTTEAGSKRNSHIFASTSANVKFKTKATESTKNVAYSTIANKSENVKTMTSKGANKSEKTTEKNVSDSQTKDKSTEKISSVGENSKTTTDKDLKKSEETAKNSNIPKKSDDKNSGKSTDTKGQSHTTVKTKLFVETTESKNEFTGEPLNKKDKAVSGLGNTLIIVGICCGFLVIVMIVGIVFLRKKLVLDMFQVF